MDAGAAVQQVKKELESTFGGTMANTILSMARTKVKAPLIGMTKDDYQRMIEAICTDPKVGQMLGASGAKEKLNKWKGLV